MTVRDYDTTASNNTSIEGIGLSDAMLANALDNAIRAMMADSANLLLDIAKPTDTTGSGGAYALSTGGTVSTLEDKVRLVFRPNFTNTGAATLNVDGTGAKAMKVYDPAGVRDPSAGQLQSGGVYDAVYVSAVGQWIVLNPSPIAELSQDPTPQLGGDLDTNGNAVFWSKGADVASASDLSPGTDGNSFDVTGTTAITSIDVAANAFGIGSLILLQFDGALTLTHHATDLILPGGANITTAAGDAAIFQKYATGDWRCISYERASGKALVGATLQVVSSQDGAYADNTAAKVAMPLDNTIPQITEGTEWLSVTITPKSATSTLVIEVLAHLATNGAGSASVQGALFKDAGANAIAATSVNSHSAAGGVRMHIRHTITSGTTSAQTFSFRAGRHDATTLEFNGDGAGGGILGGVLASGITITEIE